MSKVEKKQINKKILLTTREKLWKQVNKKVTQVKYTFDPTLYEHSLFYEDIPQKPFKAVLNEQDNHENSHWVQIMTEIDWSELENNSCPDVEEEYKPLQSNLNNFDWSQIQK